MVMLRDFIKVASYLFALHIFQQQPEDATDVFLLFPTITAISLPIAMIF